MTEVKVERKVRVTVDVTDEVLSAGLTALAQEAADNVKRMLIEHDGSRREFADVRMQISVLGACNILLDYMGEDEVELPE